MEFWDYLSSKKEQKLEGLSEELIKKLFALLSRGHSVADLHAHYYDEFGQLPAQRLAELATLRRNYMLWKKRKDVIEEARAKARVAPFPAELDRVTTTAHGLDAAVRIARLSPREDATDIGQWLDILKSGIDLWDRCLALTKKNAKLKTLAKAKISEKFDDYIGKNILLEDIAAHRWLALRRGEKEKALDLEFEFPIEEMKAQVVLLQDKLGPSAKERNIDSLLEELVLNDLKPWLLNILDQEAEEKSIRIACKNLSDLLKSPPLQVRRLGGLFIGGKSSPIGLVVCDREGELIAERVIKATKIDSITNFFNEHNVYHVALPLSAPASDLLNNAIEQLNTNEIQIASIRPAAISEARLPLMDPPFRYRQSVASALVIARRALDPIKEWALVDPASIGIAEYQNDLNEKRLASALKDTLEFCKLERRRAGKTQSKQPTSQKSNSRPITPSKKNPKIKSIRDIKPGMIVSGTVSNISHFGAFINLGLPQEALVHISELSDSFVSNPNEIVSIGQEVNAFVLSTDTTRGRISLSLKSNPVLTARAGGASLDDVLSHKIREAESKKADDVANEPKEQLRIGPTAKPTSNKPAATASAAPKSPPPKNPKSRSEALANLEQLFKK